MMESTVQQVPAQSNKEDVPPQGGFPRSTLMLDSYVQYLVNYLDSIGALDDGSFTFPNGDTWESTR